MHRPRSAADYTVHSPKNWLSCFNGENPEPSQKFTQVSTVSHTPSTMTKSVAFVTSFTLNNDADSIDSSNDESLPMSMTCNLDEVRRGKCFQCRSIFPKYCDELYCNIRLQGVMDYIDKVGLHNATDTGPQVKAFLMNKYGHYETNLMMNIPR